MIPDILQNNTPKGTFKIVVTLLSENLIKPFNRIKLDRDQCLLKKINSSFLINLNLQLSRM